MSFTRFTAAVAVAASALGLGCVGSDAAPQTTTPRIPAVQVVHVSTWDTVADLRAQLRDVAGRLRADDEACAFYWGDVAARPPDAARLTIVWSVPQMEGEVEGFLLCGEDNQFAMQDPRAQDVALMFWHQGRMQIAPLAAAGAVPFERTGLEDIDAGPADAAAVIDLDTSDAHVPAARLLERLQTLPSTFVFAAMPIGS